MMFPSEKFLLRIILTALFIGVLYRLYPVVAGQPQLSQFFVTEDGYLMLTIARNMAIGLGMSVSEGTIPSNGVQPLSTFLFAIPYAITGGDKVVSLIGVHLITAVFAVAGIFSVRSLARMVLEPLDSNPLWPWLTAALWFLGPLLVFHSMNGLETGLYTFMVTTTLVLFGKLLEKQGTETRGEQLLLGVACGVMFLSRNDGALLVISIFAIWGLHSLIIRQVSILRMLNDLVPPGLVCLALAAPWLINNYVNFGSIVPVSGTAQSLSGGFAKNANLLPAVLFEHMFPMLPIPHSLQFKPVFQIAALAIVSAVLLAFLARVLRRGGEVRIVVATYLVFAIVMSAFYGFYFGAGWFLSRYLAPLAPLFIIASVYVVVMVLKKPEFVRGLGSAAIGLSVALLAYLILPGSRDQGHFQVVNWVEKNVDEETWLGAIQTGTVGYWHDRTINLDGKVNPDALDAIQTEGHVLNYVLDSEIEVLADWYGLLTWMERDDTRFPSAFEVVVGEPQSNLGVLRRK